MSDYSFFVWPSSLWTAFLRSLLQILTSYTDQRFLQRGSQLSSKDVGVIFAIFSRIWPRILVMSSQPSANRIQQCICGKIQKCLKGFFLKWSCGTIASDRWRFKINWSSVSSYCEALCKLWDSTLYKDPVRNESNDLLRRKLLSVCVLWSWRSSL